MMMAGGPAERWVEFDSVLDCEAAKGTKGYNYQCLKTHTTNTHDMAVKMHIILNN